MLRNEYALRDVLFDLPPIRRVDFLDVDREEVDPILESVIDAIEGPRLGPKRRSGITPEDQRHGPIFEPLG